MNIISNNNRRFIIYAGKITPSTQVNVCVHSAFPYMRIPHPTESLYVCDSLIAVCTARNPTYTK